MTRNDIAQIFPDATEEQITNLLNLNGSDIQKVKGSHDTLKTQLSDAQAEISRLKEGPTAEKLQAEVDRANGLQQQLDALQQENATRLIREKVAGERNIPVKLLTASTEEECIGQADAILAFANAGSYPAVKDGGEPSGAQSPSTRDSFAGWAEKLL